MGVSKELLVRRRNLDTPHIATVTGAVASFAGNMAAPFKELKCEFTPVQSGSGDPSPSNVRPISGWTGVTVNRTGKNLFNENSEAPLMDVFNYAEQPQVRRGIRVNVPPGVYTAKANGNGTGADAYLNINLINADGTFAAYGGLVAGSNTYTRSMTVSTGQYIAIFDQQATTASTATKFTGWDIQLELGSTATTYEPYTGNTYAVDWTDEAGTVYGGYVDPVRGVLVAEWEYGDMGDLSWDGASYAASSYATKKSYLRAFLGSNVTPKLFVDQFNVVSINTFNKSVGVNGHWASINSGGNFYIMTPAISGMTSIQIQEYVTGKKYAVLLATPTEYPLTPQVIKTLKGTNNVFSNLNGNTTVKYWKH